MKTLNRLQKVALAVGLYDLLVGLFPLMAMDLFINVTGLNHHLDVVRMIATAWALLGAALILFQRSRTIVPVLGVMSLIAGSCLALTEIGLVISGRVSPIFLVQAAMELTIGATWIIAITGLKYASEAHRKRDHRIAV